MKTVFDNKRISGILGILPETVCYFEDEMIDGASVRNQKIKKNMGYGRRYRVKPDTTTSQLCCQGLHYLLDNGIVKKDEIAAILVVSLTPDYYVPQISNLIHADFNLPKDVFAMDLWSGCSGYIDGLFHAFTLLEHIDDKKVLLFTGDILNRMSREKEKYVNPPYGGDGASITIVENTKQESRIPFAIKNDGRQKDLIAFYQGAFADIFHRNSHLSDGVVLQPAESFRFFQKCIPDLLMGFFDDFEIKREDIDFYCFIQANKLSVKKFADKLQIPYEKVSMEFVEKYGDLSATLNPIGIIDRYGDALLGNDAHKVAICGYGAGVRWGTTVLELNNLDICKNIIVNL